MKRREGFIFASIFCGVLILSVLILGFYAKLPPSFFLITSRTLDSGVDGPDGAIGMVMDENGTLYVTGYMSFPGHGPDIWLAKFDSNLNLQKNITIDGSAHGEDVGYTLALDNAGFLYLVGYLTELNEGHNIFLAKFRASDLAIQKNITINGPVNETDDGYGILYDGSGMLYIAGTITELNEGYNIYLGKYDTDLNLQTEITRNGPANKSDKARFLARTPDGTLFVSGSISQINTNYDFWIGKFDSNLTFLDETILASETSGEDKAYGLFFDGVGTLYITGAINDTLQGLNILLAKYDLNLHQIQNTTLNGPANGEDVGYTLIQHDNGLLYLTGTYTEISSGSNIWLGCFTTSLTLLSNITIDGLLHVYDTGYGIIKGLNSDFYLSGLQNNTLGGTDIWLARYGI